MTEPTTQTEASGAPEPEGPGRSSRRWLRRALEAVLIGAALFLAVDLISEIGWEELRAQLEAASRPLVVATAALLFTRYLAWNARWQLALHRVGVTGSFFRGLVALLSAAAVNHLTPSFRVFGGLLRARYVSRARSAPFATTYGAVLFDQIANQTVMGALSAVAFVTVALRLEHAAQAAAGVIVVIALLLLVPLLLRRSRRRRAEEGDAAEDVVSWIGRRLRALISRGRQVLSTVDHLIRDPALLAGAAALSLVYASLNIGGAWLAFLALGHSPPIASVFLTVSLGVTIGALSGTPGGSLTTEAAMVTCYGLLGIDSTIALAATLLYRGLHYLIVVTLGVPSLAVLELLHRRAAPDKPEQQAASR